MCESNNEVEVIVWRLSFCNANVMAKLDDDEFLEKDTCNKQLDLEFPFLISKRRI